jgi:DNA repair protein RAD7
MMFATMSKANKVVLRNACQFKDETMEYMLDKLTNLSYVQLYGANLVSNKMWIEMFKKLNKKLKVLKLSWLDASFDDDAVAQMVKSCPNLERLKLKRCRKITRASIDSISKLKKLEHLSLQPSITGDVDVIPGERLVNLIGHLGPKLETLSLEGFVNAEDDFLDAVHKSCTRLIKFRFTENDWCTNAGYVSFFTKWGNPALQFIDLNSTRDVDNQNPEGPQDAPNGLADSGFTAMMAHSGSQLQYLDISSCRHISLGCFLDVFNPNAIYPELTKINLSFCSSADTTVVAGIFKSCPALKQLVAFGCFGIQDVIVPRDVVLIGVPRAQDAIEMVGDSLLNVDQALGKMLQVTA